MKYLICFVFGKETKSLKVRQLFYNFCNSFAYFAWRFLQKQTYFTISQHLKRIEAKRLVSSLKNFVTVLTKVEENFKKFYFIRTNE